MKRIIYFDLLHSVRTDSSSFCFCGNMFGWRSRGDQSSFLCRNQTVRIEDIKLSLPCAAAATNNHMSLSRIFTLLAETHTYHLFASSYCLLCDHLCARCCICASFFIVSFVIALSVFFIYFNLFRIS